MELKLIFMVLIIASLGIIYSCENDDETNSNTNSTPTTYRCQSNITYSGCKETIYVYEYNKNNERIACNSFTSVSCNAENYTANAQAVKVKIYVIVTKITTGQTTSFWIAQVYYLNIGGYTYISFDNNTLAGDFEP